jgi:HK97 family phage prohead protease
MTAPILVRSGGTASVQTPEDHKLGTSSMMPMLLGRLAPYDEWTVVDGRDGLFMERVGEGAFTRTLREDRPNIRILYDHGFDRLFGRRPIAPLELLVDEPRGLVYGGTLFDTVAGRELVPGLRAGVFGSSWRMQVVDAEERSSPRPSEFNPEGLPERTLREVRIIELGPTPFPVYVGSSASARMAAPPRSGGGRRSLTDDEWEMHLRGLSAASRR